jgi:hypothetical protein
LLPNPKPGAKANKRGSDNTMKPDNGGKLTATVIDPTLLQQTEEALVSSQGAGVYATISSFRHALSASTLLDNCGAMHVVNSASLLEPGSFIWN